MLGGSSAFFPDSLENSRNLGEKACGLLDLWVTFCFHFLTGGKAGNQTEQFDLDSQPQVNLVIVPVFLRRPKSLSAQELLEISEHGGVRFIRPIRPPMECQVLRGKVGKDPSLVQESKPGIKFGGGDFNVRRDSPAGRERPPSSVKKWPELDPGSSSRLGVVRAVPGRGR